MNNHHMAGSRNSPRSNERGAFLISALCIGALLIIVLAILTCALVAIRRRRRENERECTSAAVSAQSENDANVKKMEQCLSTKVWSEPTRQTEEVTATQIDIEAPFSQQEMVASDCPVDSGMSNSCSKNMEDGPENINLQQQQRQQEVCAICLGAYHDGDLIVQSSNRNCQHEFHRSCIAEWLTKNDECPCCRQTFLVYKEEKLSV